MTLREHVGGHTSALLRRLSAQVRHGITHSDEDSVHDLRVSIRRLRECLRAFKEVFPPAPRKTIRKRLRDLMKAAERVRSVDIALKLMEKAGLEETASELQDLRKTRDQYYAVLRGELTSFAKQPYTRTWREALKI